MNWKDKLIDRFYRAFWSIYGKSPYYLGFHNDLPNKSTFNSYDKIKEYYQCQIEPNSYQLIESQYDIKYPSLFKEWHSFQHFHEGDLSFVRLPENPIGNTVQSIAKSLGWSFSKELTQEGIVPFAEEGNNTGPYVFDQRNATNVEDSPIRVYDYTYGGELNGLSEVIFSNFKMLLECAIHYLENLGRISNSKLMIDFLHIDPNGAGYTGIEYWKSWSESYKYIENNKHS